MSAHPDISINTPNRKPRRLMPYALQQQKQQTPFVCLTCYTTPMARLLDDIVDILLVGDSLGMIVYGLPSTLAVSMDMMINHGAAVVRGTQRACVIVDMPFASYQESPQQAFRNAARLLQETGCQAVKIEGGKEMAETVHFLTQRGIPVMAHIGLLPQSFNVQGGFKVQGKTPSSAQNLEEAALLFEQAGAFAILIEGTSENVAGHISSRLKIPTIGIGASLHCDGQILVTEDILGLYPDFTPKFAKKYVDVATIIKQAATAYANDVRQSQFPSTEHLYNK